MKLPGSLILTPVTDLQDWQSMNRLPVWEVKLSIANMAMISCNLIITLLGAIKSIRQNKWAGIVPLLFFFGYHLGNGAAITAGDRYLQPVFWVILVYFSIGLFEIFNFLLINTSFMSLKYKKLNLKPSSINLFLNKEILSVITVFLIACLLPFTTLLEKQIHTFSEFDLINYTKKTIIRNTNISVQALDHFLESPNSLIVEGLAYHPRIYDSPLVHSQKNPFELTVLGEDFVHISNYFLENLKWSRSKMVVES